MKFEDIQVRMKLTIGFCTASRDELVNVADYLDEEEWNAMDDKEKQIYIEEVLVKEWANEYIEMSAELVGEHP